MRKHQEERFQDAQEMLRALQDIHLMDQRYRNTAAAQKIVAIASVLMVAAGAACVAFGVQRMGQERVMLYDSLVRSGRTAGEAMQFDAAEQALQKAVSFMTTGWRLMWNRRSSSIGRGHTRNVWMKLVPS